jgi:hypothetical protein
VVAAAVLLAEILINQGLRAAQVDLMLVAMLEDKHTAAEQVVQWLQLLTAVEMLGLLVVRLVAVAVAIMELIVAKTQVGVIQVAAVAVVSFAKP